MPNLTSLRISCSEMLDSQFQQLSPILPNLKELTLYRTKLSSASFRLIQENCGSLETLHLDELPDITPHDIDILVSTPSLTAISLMDTDPEYNAVRSSDVQNWKSQNTIRPSLSLIISYAPLDQDLSLIHI